MYTFLCALRWLRITQSREKLQNDIDRLLEYCEKKCNYNMPKSVLNELSKFQTFLITTKDNKNDTKTEQFQYD